MTGLRGLRFSRGTLHTLLRKHNVKMGGLIAKAGSTVTLRTLVDISRHAGQLRTTGAASASRAARREQRSGRVRGAIRPHVLATAW